MSTKFAPISLGAEGARLLTEQIAPVWEVDDTALFRGAVLRGAVVAQCLAALGALASSQFYDHALASGADPVITTDGERIRFEALSGCRGVYAQVDVLPSALRGSFGSPGTTNVDIDPPLQTQLRQFNGDVLHLEVRAEGLSVTDRTGTQSQPAVVLPSRWLESFAESGPILAGLDLRAEVSGLEGVRFFRAISGSATGPGVHAVRATAGRLVDGALLTADAVCLADTQRLDWLVPVMTLAERVRLFGAPMRGGETHPSCGAIELTLPDARLVVLLSPAAYRGLSGEGSTAKAERQRVDGPTLATLEVLAKKASTLDAGSVAADTGLPLSTVRAGLLELSAQGFLGYDLGGGTYFVRRFPDSARVAQKPNARLRKAESLLQSNSITARDGYVAVAGDSGEHHVRAGSPEPTCTCEWWRRYSQTRGSCAHVLAAQMAGYV